MSLNFLFTIGSWKERQSYFPIASHVVFQNLEYEMEASPCSNMNKI